MKFAPLIAVAALATSMAYASPSFAQASGVTGRGGPHVLQPGGGYQRDRGYRGDVVIRNDRGRRNGLVGAEAPEPCDCEPPVSLIGGRAWRASLRHPMNVC